jgi:hypothetical protein
MKKNVFKLNFKTCLALLLLMYSANVMHAQEALITSGTNISGGGASVSYTIGQLISENIESASGSAIHGIQFSYASSTLNIIDLETNLDISTYPNPTSAFLNLKIDNNSTNKLTYSLFNILGESIINGKITDNTTTINVDHLPNAAYLLIVTNNTTKSIKTFKIIKN